MAGFVTAPAGTPYAYRPALDGVRAVAVVAVILYHLDYAWASGGFLGVDTFFVLSGYLITSLLVVEYSGTDRIALGSFWLRRARRLLPALLLLLVAVAAYAEFIASSDRLGALRGDGLAALFYVANWRSIFTEASYFDLFSDASPLRHVWSLAIEEQFYLVWPLVVLGALRLGRGRTRLLTLATGAIAALSVLVMAVTFDLLDPSRAYYGTDSRIHQLLIGALLALTLRAILRRYDECTVRRWVSLFGTVAAIGLTAAFVLASATSQSYYRGGSVAFAVLSALVIAAAAEAPGSRLSRSLARPPIRWIGRISYGLYLWHWPIIVWLTAERVEVDGTPLTVVRLAAMISVTAGSYYLLEQPIRFGRFTPRIAVTGFPAAVVGCAGLLVVTTTGATTNTFAEATVFTVPPVPTSDTPGDRVDGDRPRVGIVGDSVANSLAPGFVDVLAPTHRVANVTFPGCGLAAGVAVLPDGRVWEPSIDCAEEVPRVHERYIARDDPDLILWYSEWEVGDRLVDGEVAPFGSPRHTTSLVQDLEATYERLTASGAHVTILLNVPRAAADDRPDDIDWNGRALAYNEILRDLAHRYPDTSTVIDLPEIVCPGGPPCPSEVSGFELRPDGAHYTVDAARWLSRQMAPIINSLTPDAQQPLPSPKPAE